MTSSVDKQTRHRTRLPGNSIIWANTGQLADCQIVD